MEVREGQILSTIEQAMAHNTRTIQSDLPMLKALLKARGETVKLAQCDEALRHLTVAYNTFLQMFADTLMANEVGCHTHNVVGSEHVHVHPSDAEIVREATALTHRAEKYESR
jgi:hypothetical protein